MVKAIVLFFAFLQGCSAELDEITFVKNANLTNYMPTSGYILEDTSRSVSHCGATCLKTTNCTSFFFDSNSKVCQLHSTVPDNITEMTSSLTANCYVDQAYNYSITPVCPNGTFPYNNGEICYYIYDSLTFSFNGAKDFCTDNGWEIVKIDDATQFMFITQILQQNAASQEFYIGLNDEQVDGHYRWSDNATSIPAYTNWGSAQPVAGSENCVLLLRPDTWRWHSTYCSDVNAFLCQI